MKIQKTSLYLLFTISLFLLQGCSAVDHQQFFDNHEKAFKEKTNYTSHHVQRGKSQIYVREFGTRNQYPTLIMMHGFPDSMHLYDWLVPELMDDRHIIAFDFLGWGDSDKPANHRYDFASLRKDLEAVIDQLKLNHLVLVLHDASGIPGIDWALDNPDKTAGIVLLNTFYNPMPTLKVPKEIATFSTPGIGREVSVLATRISDALWIKRYKEQMARFISNKERREPFQKVLGHQSFEIRPAFYQLNKVLQQEVTKRSSKTPEIKNYKKPVRIIFGNDDPNLNAGVAKEFHKLFANSELFLINGAGHFVQVDKPERVAELLKSFPKSAN